MSLKKINLKDWNSVREHIKTHMPAYYTYSGKVPDISVDRCTLADLSNIPKKISFRDDNIIISGPVTWGEISEVLSEKNRTILSFSKEPNLSVAETIINANVDSTFFSGGPLANQIEEIKFLNYQGKEVHLPKNKELMLATDKGNELLHDYLEESECYHNLRYPLIPKFNSAIDLMIGTEGQLGIIKEITLKTTPVLHLNYYLVQLPSWRTDLKAHLEFFNKVQNYRKEILSIHFFDNESMSFTSGIGLDGDIILLKITRDHFDDVYGNFLEKLEHVEIDHIHQIDESKLNKTIEDFEHNSKKHMEQDSVDEFKIHYQSSTKQFEAFFKRINSFANKKIQNHLFGQLADAELVFTVLKNTAGDEYDAKLFDKLTADLVDYAAYPVIRHPYNLDNQKQLCFFLAKIHLDMFSYLKQEFDPYNQFCPGGFLTNLAKNMSNI